MGQDEIYLFFVGTAGSGKSTLTSVYRKWAQIQNIDTILVNLDPGAENLPYTPDVDVRDWISLEEIMDSHGLGPNGAQIACADLIALNIHELKESIDSFHSHYVIIDTPGQLELFVFRESGKHIIHQFHDYRSVIVYLIDYILAKNPSGFISQLLLSLSTNFRIIKPQINVLSKADMLSDDEKMRVMDWAKDPDFLTNALVQEQASIYREMAEGILQLLQQFQSYAPLIATGKEGFLGIDDLYTAIQIIHEGGEDKGQD